MIYLTTGGNGAGKTLFTLWDVRQAQLKEPTRPVYYHGFRPKQAIEDFGWLPFEPEKWQDLPDGSICIFDECQNEMPAKIEGKLPDWINAIAQHRRRRGFDFWLITPHPSMIHLNVRRLIESPSWHRHMKRTFGTDNVSQLTFNFAELKCEQPSSGARGQVQMRAYPKEAYEWYESATKHTGKKRIPRQVYVLAAAALLVPLLGWYAFHKLGALGDADRIAKATGVPMAQDGGVSYGHRGSGALSADEYVAAHVPRLPGFPNTAPRYDGVTEPVTAPYPAACVASARGCRCYTQQATRLHVPEATCLQIVESGYFVDWDTRTPAERDSAASRRASGPLVGGPSPVGVSAPGAAVDGQVIASMRGSL